jgi:hypothetical protein
MLSFTMSNFLAFVKKNRKRNGQATQATRSASTMGAMTTRAEQSLHLRGFFDNFQLYLIKTILPPNIQGG